MQKRKETFYHHFHSPDKLEPGISLSLERNLEYNAWNVELSPLSELVKLSPKELEDKRKASAKLEQGIFGEIQAALQEWEQQAAQTMILDRALEYVHTPGVSHTSNEWVQHKDGTWEISNQTYIMTFKIWEDTGKPGTFLVSWELGVNRPKRPKTEKHYYSGSPSIAEQTKKRYDTSEAAQKYIQGRFDLYSHLFTELRPPIPDGFQRAFTINGCLLPEYTVSPPKRASSKDIDDLLDFLEDKDIFPSDQKEPSAPAAKKGSRPAAQKKSSRKKSAPIR
jgi:hypothetical protein